MSFKKNRDGPSSCQDQKRKGDTESQKRSVCRPWMKGNGGVEEGRNREGRDEEKKKKEKKSEEEGIG